MRLGSHTPMVYIALGVVVALTLPLLSGPDFGAEHTDIHFINNEPIHSARVAQENADAGLRQGLAGPRELLAGDRIR